MISFLSICVDDELCRGQLSGEDLTKCLCSPPLKLDQRKAEKVDSGFCFRLESFDSRSEGINNTFSIIQESNEPSIHLNEGSFLLVIKSIS